MAQSSMSEEFHDWLSECPVQWFRNNDDGNGTSSYTFVEDVETDEEVN